GPTRKFRLALFLDVSLLAGFNCRRDRTSLTGGCVAGLGYDFAGFGRSGVVELGRAIARRLVILSCRFAGSVVVFAGLLARRVIILGGLGAQLLRRFSGAVNAFTRGVRDVVTQFLARLRREQQGQHRADARPDQEER